jgi:hypothetical protein
VKSLSIILAIVLAWFGYWYLHRPIIYPPGVLVPSDPDQLDLPLDTPPFEYGSFHLKPLAVFSIDARLLHRKTYRFDQQAALVPVDLALGWGPMSDQRVLDRLNITQSMRFYWYKYNMPPPIARDQIISHSTNVHVIPATKEIVARCKSLRTGSLIHLGGDLVAVSGPGIGNWQSSLSRTDTGNGACELMWVKELSILSENGLRDQKAVVSR